MRLKAFLLHYNAKHNESFISDPESPAEFSVALLNHIIVCVAIGAQTGVFIMGSIHVNPVY